MNELTTTLAAIREHDPCQEGWAKLLAYLGKRKADEKPLLFETILDSNGLDDAMWCLRTLGHQHNGTCRLFAVWCARQVQHIMSDHRSLNALDVADRHANGDATDQELSAARDAALDAARAARSAAWDAALDAAWDAALDAALDAARAARAAALDAAWDAALDAARAAARASDGAAWDARAAARAAARDAQSAKFREICRAGQFVPDAKKEGAAQ